MDFSYVDHPYTASCLCTEKFYCKKAKLICLHSVYGYFDTESQRYVVETDIIWFAKPKIITVWSLAFPDFCFYNHQYRHS